MGRCKGEQGQLLYAFDLEVVLDDHQVRKIAAVLDLSWVRVEFAPHYSNTGRPSVDPELMIRMLILGYVFAIRSEHCARRAAVFGCPCRSGRTAINTILVEVPLSSFCNTEKSVAPLVAGTTTSPSMIAEPALMCQASSTILRKWLVQSLPRRVKTSRPRLPDGLGHGSRRAVKFLRGDRASRTRRA